MGYEARHRASRGQAVQGRVLQRQVEGEDVDEEGRSGDRRLRLDGLSHPRPLQELQGRTVKSKTNVFKANICRYYFKKFIAYLTQIG